MVGVSFTIPHSVISRRQHGKTSNSTRRTGPNPAGRISQAAGRDQYRVAKKIGVPQRCIVEIVAGKRAITADTAARFGVYFSVEAEFWLNLQMHYDLARTREMLAAYLAEIHPLVQAA